MSAGGGLGLGDAAPPLELTDTEGVVHALPEAGEANATVVVWTCNHCPYALAWHDRLMEAALEYRERGVRFVCVNSNDPVRYPRDSIEAMRERVAANEFACPYLHDPSQEAARAWGPRTTPDVFVLDPERRLRYRGAPDSDHRDPAQAAAWLRGAVDAILAGDDPDPPETEPVGCSIKWKQH